MCGRSQFLSVPEVVECFAPARAGDVAGVVTEAFPGSVVPGLVAHGGERVVSSFTWGFFDDGSGHNARLETAATRPAWRAAFAGARLVLPLAAFVEGRAWFRGAEALAVAGLYRLGAPGPSRRRATMLTRPSDPVVTPFHDRMPVILTSDLVDPWLAGDPVSVEGLLADSPPLAAEPMAPVQAPGPEQQSLL